MRRFFCDKIYYKVDNKVKSFWHDIPLKSGDFYNMVIEIPAKNRKLEAPHAPLEYKNWYIQQVKKCYFCGNDNETIKRYLEKIGEKITKQQNRLGIDRMDSSKGYLLENLTLACSICNTHKSDIISADDFKEIARDYIAPKIKKTI